MFFRISVALSLALHLCLVVILTFVSKPKIKNKVVDTLEFEVVERKTMPKGQNKTGKDKNNKDGISNVDALSIKNFLPGISYESELQNHKGFDHSNTQWGSGGSDFKRIEDYSLMNMIYQQVNGHLFYPTVFIRNNIRGTVTTRLVLNETGDCDWARTSIKTSNKHLKVYVLSVLKKVCRINYAAHLNKRTQTNIDMSFDFHFNEHRDQNVIARNNLIIGNVLLFYRSAHKSALQWNFGPFTGVFPAPFVGVDFVWLKNNWDEYVLGDAEPPIEKFKKNL